MRTHPGSAAAGRWLLETERFDTTAEAIRSLRDWLIERAVEVIALEATSDYWRAVYYPLQDVLGLVPIDHLAAMGELVAAGTG